MLRYPIGIQSFEKLRNNDFLYIDKTAMLAALVDVPGSYLMCRPRRFGKSLLLSTLEAYFQGRKDLFEGLAIARKPTTWLQRVVFRVDLSAANYTEEGALEAKLTSMLSRWETEYGKSDADVLLPDRFAACIRRAAEASKLGVVILVDEYDKPLIETIHNETLHTHNRNVLKGFYGCLKSCDEYIHFGLITGVTKFSHVSIFSDLNNLIDISRDARYDTLCGITDAELSRYCGDAITQFASSHNITDEQTRLRLKETYDGYRFVPDGECLYNPFSLFNALSRNSIEYYWSRTGTPTFIVELLKRGNYDLTLLDNDITVGEETLDAFDMQNVIGIMYQTGYLTIKRQLEPEHIFTLGFPNAEVKNAFVSFLTPLYYTNVNAGTGKQIAQQLSLALRAGAVDEMMRLMQTLIASIPCESRDERMLELHYRNMFYLTFSLCGHRVQVERPVLHGRIDVVIETPKRVYLIELKRGDNLEEAVRQFHDRDYRAAYAGDSRATVQIAATINDATHNIARWQVLGSETSDH